MRRNIGLILILLFFSSTVFTQQEEVEIKRSTEKVMLEGKVYFIHFVKENETLNAISKAYNINEKIIALENPDVFAGIRAGMVLKIPADPVHAEEITIQSTDDFHYHIIREGETLYFLSKKYGITVEEIEKFNPEVEYSELQINQVIKIPKQQAQQPRDTFPSEDHFFHYVRKGETFYSLSVYYGVTIDEIKQLNPELKWGELRFDEYIKIPRKQWAEEKDTLPVVSVPAEYDSVISRIDTTGMFNWMEITCDTMVRADEYSCVKVGLFLPLFLRWQELLDSLALQARFEETADDAEDEQKHEQEDNLKVNPRVIGYLDFYEGILLALDSLRNAGISVTLYVYDTERDADIFNGLLKRNEVQNLDLIIGPVEDYNLEAISDFAKERHIPVVSPFTEISSLLQSNTCFYQMIPSPEIEFRNWAKFLADYWDDTMILVHNGDSLEAKKIDFLKQELYEKLCKRTYFGDVNIKEVIISDSASFEMEQFLTRGDRNIIIIPSTNEAYVGKILPELFLLIEDYDIQVFGMSNWHKFQSIDLDYMHQMEVHYYTSFYVDYTQEPVVHFIRKFRNIYGTEPFHVGPRGYNLSIYGFDLLYYFVSGMNKYGKQFISCPLNRDYHPMLGPYVFMKREPSGGFMNQHTAIIRYGKDLNIKELTIEEPPGVSEPEDISTLISH